MWYKNELVRKGRKTNSWSSDSVLSQEASPFFMKRVARASIRVLTYAVKRQERSCSGIGQDPDHHVGSVRHRVGKGAW